MMPKTFQAKRASRAICPSVLHFFNLQYCLQIEGNLETPKM